MPVYLIYQYLMSKYLFNETGLPGSGSPGQQGRWHGITGSALALAIAETAQRSNARGLTLVIVPDAAQAQQLGSEIRFFGNEAAALPVFYFPDWETLPYDSFSPHQDIISERLAILNRLCAGESGILVVPVTSLMNRLAPRQWLQASSFQLDPAHPSSYEQLRKQLEGSGYQLVNTVYEHGEYALRGSLIDIFPMGSIHPFRIDFFDNQIESIRIFDVESQRTTERIEKISLLPAHEYPLDKQSIHHFCNQWHEVFPERNAKQCPVYQDVASGISPAGIEYYLPLFFEETSQLFDYLPDHCQVIITGDIEKPATQYWHDIQLRYEEQNIDPFRPLLPPTKVFMTVEDVFRRVNQYPLIKVFAGSDQENNNPAICPLPELGIHTQSENPLKQLKEFIDSHKDITICFSAESPGRREALIEMLSRIQIKPGIENQWADIVLKNNSVSIVVSPVSEGFLLKNKIALITETELFGKQVYQKRRRQQTTSIQQDAIIKNLNELKEGSPVVHIDHGVGRYRGMVTLMVDMGDRQKSPAEFILLEYADQAKLYIPVSSLHLISRYTGGDEEHAPLHRMGSDQWHKAKRKAAEQVRDVAAELLEIHARRASRKGFAFTDPAEDMKLFANEFPFEETADQKTAIDAVIKDMLSGNPMDRLVCGDVGFGKTEVAMRAAFIAVHNKKQVAILVPTTLLAQQHYENFKDRFANWPVRIEALSRFRTDQEKRKIIESLSSGEIDILIGTHQIIQRDVRFQQLGLVIIDEEHRFGVQQKERLKALRSEVDILTLTATPIPRTLNMAMSGMRDFSIIATPPSRRLSVKTFVRQKEVAIIKEAILRELLRGGQVFYLHNDVQTIERVREDLEKLVPEARIAVGHGQMRERQLEKVMIDFYHKRHNVLVCTTIIETGIDIPSANTIIIDRADKFGIAQLHQLRGRVGRSHHQAYAYLLTPGKKSMTADAIKRLEAIEQSEALGSGFTLATHDLEIRGAGELLGESQSGQIESIGFSLYMDMLDRAVKAIREGKLPDIENPLPEGAEVDLGIPALIPQEWIADPQIRLILYKRIASAGSETELKELQVEMIDRFGLLPEPCKSLFRLTSIKLELEALGIRKLQVNHQGGKLDFNTRTRVHPLTIVKLVQNQPQRYKLQNATQLRFIDSSETVESRFQLVHNLINLLKVDAIPCT